MTQRLETRSARDHGDVAAFFDECAPAYREQHGDAAGLLAYRLDLLRRAAAVGPDDVVLEIGCGTGLHLLSLADEIGRGVGVDLSPAMIRAARERSVDDGLREKITFEVDTAETLDTVDDASVDVALCVGALEHMLDQAAVLESAIRVLKGGGRLACLTLNGGSLWYRYLAPGLGFDTRQLTTDRYLDRRSLDRLVRAAGFEKPAIDHWTFIQRGDMPGAAAVLCGLLDRLGRTFRIGALRGGLRLAARKP